MSTFKICQKCTASAGEKVIWVMHTKFSQHIDFRTGLNRQDAVTEASRVLSPQGSQRRPLDYPYGITSNENYMEPSYGRGQRSSYETADPYSSQQYPQDARQGPYASLPDTRRPDPNAFPPYPENPYAIPNNSMGPTPSRFGGVGEQSYAPHTPSHPSNPYGPISEASWDPTQGRRERPGDKEATGSQMLRRNKYGLGDCPVDGCRFFGRNGLQDRAHLREHLRQYHPLDPR